MEEGKIESTKLITGVQKGTSNDQMRYTNVIYIPPMTMDGSCVTNQEIVYKLAAHLKDEIGKETEIVKEINQDYMRKVLEILFRGTDTPINVISKLQNRTGYGPKRNTD